LGDFLFYEIGFRGIGEILAVDRGFGGKFFGVVEFFVQFRTGLI
jgi:hypothetical protein